MKNQHPGWLCIVSKETQHHKLKLFCTTKNPDSVINRQNELHRYPGYKPYTLEYRTYVRDLLTIIKRIREAVGTSEKAVWFECSLSEMIRIIECEKHKIDITDRDEGKETTPDIWACNPYVRIPRGSDIYKIENIKTHFEVKQKAHAISRWKRKIESGQGVLVDCPNNHCKRDSS